MPEGALRVAVIPASRRKSSAWMADIDVTACAWLIFIFYERNLQVVSTFAQPVARRSDRRTTKMAILVFVEREREMEMEWEGYDAFTLDVSAQGARIEAGVSLTPGQVVEVVPINGSGPVTGRVVWVGKPASELEGQAGLEFLDPFNAPT